jgi:8-oxo-dGTP pyrophosphatase MutT (NUDIX family)
MTLASRQGLLQLLSRFHSAFDEEQAFVTRFEQLLFSPRCYHRDHLPGHITGSAWIIDPRHERVVLVHHAKLNRWLQPGGHADGDENCLAVALREAQEETGLHEFDLISDSIFDLDIHPIPARKDFPEHLHFDVRMMMYADASVALKCSAESHEVAWIPFRDIPHLTKQNPSILRMLRKSVSVR